MDVAVAGSERGRSERGNVRGNESGSGMDGTKAKRWKRWGEAGKKQSL